LFKRRLTDLNNLNKKLLPIQNVEPVSLIKFKNEVYEINIKETISNYQNCLWIGKDYSNSLTKELEKVDLPFEDHIDRQKVPRMPWHDIGGCVLGSGARDMACHFIQQWNYIKMKKKCYSKNELLTQFQTNIKMPSHIKNFSKCNVKILRSVSRWSAGVKKIENSIYEAMKYLIKTAEHYIYIENQFFISAIDQNLIVKNEIVKCLYDRIVRANAEKKNFKVYIFLPLMPEGFKFFYSSNSSFYFIKIFFN
jgi:phospholipase D1/2